MKVFLRPGNLDNYVIERLNIETRYLALLVAVSITLATALCSALGLQPYSIGNDVLAPGPTTYTSDINATMPAGPLAPGNPKIEGAGMIIGRGVLEVHPEVKVETSFIQNDTILGKMTAFEVETYESVTRPDGSLNGEGQGPEDNKSDWRRMKKEEF